ncbi:single-stranded DNA-binding protein [Parvibaculum sp.]|uniref:single-stranded DNA-binding protein n=1 Tax=Alphaproteobacteria TaxID=28211 RepID=UPI001B2C712E|nr:single-stranded DNA-binding protein [Parvibaculum sp.]MBO6714489.1 single-stranded DNA-binding protein [Parvibaculum sp.]MBO6734649.1 single-stranded DNA-binding protein [Roseitalea sp.]
MQSVIIEGYLAADPSILAARGNGRKRAAFRVLETVRFRRGDGQRDERTTGFNCVCFNEKTAEDYIAAYARKGSRVVVSGHVENDTWTGRDGTKHYDLRLVVENLRIKAKGPRPEPVSPPDEPSTLADLDDEIPF